MPVVKKQNFKKAPAKSAGVLSRIAPVSLDENGVKMNVYGRSASGKTTFACTFPKPLLILGAENGTRSVYNVKGVDFVLLEKSGDLAELIPHVRESGKWATVVLDSASSLQDIILKEILGLEELPVQKSWGLASRDQYGQCGIQTKEYLRGLLGLTCNVVILAQEREFNVENESALLMPFVGSSMTPSTVGWFNPLCDYIVQTFLREQIVEKSVKVGDKVMKKQHKTGKVEYCIRTAPDPIYTTKFRVPKGTELPDIIADPDYSKIIELIQGGA
jgi:hypothetical protein